MRDQVVADLAPPHSGGPPHHTGMVEGGDLAEAVTDHEQLFAPVPDGRQRALDHPLDLRFPRDAGLLPQVRDREQAVPGVVLGLHPHMHAPCARVDRGGVQLPGEPPAAARQRHPFRTYARSPHRRGRAPAHREYFRRVGAGAIDWFRWAQLVQQTAQSEITLLELDAVPDTVNEMRAAREYIEQTLHRTAR